MSGPRTSALVLGYGAEPGLGECIAALAGEPDLEIVLVDNGAAPEALAAARQAGGPDLVVVTPATNLGFAGGCNAAVAASHGELLVFVNSDVVVRAGAVARLAAVVGDDAQVGAVCGSVRLRADPTTMNTAGNPVSFLGLAWAGGLGEPAARHDRPTEVASVSGGFFAMTRGTWDELGGFDPLLFAYQEDVDVSLQLRLAGRAVRYVPPAVAVHDYEFARNPRKMYLLERNRWIVLLTVFPRPVLLAALPALLAVEPGLLAVAVAQGWGRQKLEGYVWLVRHVGTIRARRRRIQSRTVIGADQFAVHLSGGVDAPVLGGSPLLRAANRVLGAYWSTARRMAGLA